MLRKGLIELLRNNSMDLDEIARHLEVLQKDVKNDLRHIMSLRHADYHLVVTPAYCRKCDFTFNKDKLPIPANARTATVHGYMGLRSISNRKPELLLPKVGRRAGSKN